MGLDRDTIARVVLHDRPRIVTLAAAIARDAHAAEDVFQQVAL